MIGTIFTLFIELVIVLARQFPVVLWIGTIFILFIESVIVLAKQSAAGIVIGLWWSVLLSVSSRSRSQSHPRSHLPRRDCVRWNTIRFALN